MLQDVNLPDGSGLDALLEYKKRQPQALVIMITVNVQLEPLFLPRIPVIPVVLLLSPRLEFCYTLA